MKLIGLSLSRCVSDLLLNYVDLKDVAGICAGICVRGHEEFRRACQTYEGEWQFSPQASQIAFHLWDNDLIYQPRLEDKDAVLPVMPRGYGRGRLRWIDADWIYEVTAKRTVMPKVMLHAFALEVFADEDAQIRLRAMESIRESVRRFLNVPLNEMLQRTEVTP